MGRNSFGNIIGSHSKSISSMQRDGHHIGSACPDNTFVGGIHRISNQNFVTSFSHTHKNGIKRGLSAGKTHDLISGNALPSPLRCTLGKGKSKSLFSATVRISCSASKHGLHSNFHQCVWGGNIRLTDGQTDNVATLIDQLFCL